MIKHLINNKFWIVYLSAAIITGWSTVVTIIPSYRRLYIGTFDEVALFLCLCWGFFIFLGGALLGELVRRIMIWRQLKK